MRVLNLLHLAMGQRKTCSASACFRSLSGAENNRGSFSGRKLNRFSPLTPTCSLRAPRRLGDSVGRLLSWDGSIERLGGANQLIRNAVREFSNCGIWLRCSSKPPAQTAHRPTRRRFLCPGRRSRAVLGRLLPSDNRIDLMRHMASLSRDLRFTFGCVISISG